MQAHECSICVALLYRVALPQERIFYAYAVLKALMHEALRPKGCEAQGKGSCTGALCRLQGLRRCCPWA